MTNFWRWKCENCGYVFTLTLASLPSPCHRCAGEWFLKVGECETKDSKPDTPQT